ncbi:MAG: VanZ family protein [Thermoanaerobaculia bacterium]|nr:VanZ family protein [Thermoanaerobaculia bacterium]
MPSPPLSSGSRRLLSAWTVVVLVSLWWPGSPEGLDLPWLPDPPGIDLWIHGLLFFPFGFLWARAEDTPGETRPGWVAIGTTVGLALVTEWGQGWVPGRSPELVDLGADLVGSFVGWILGGWAFAGARGDRWIGRSSVLPRRLGEISVMGLILGVTLVTLPGSSDAFDLPKRVWSEVFGLLSLCFLAPILARSEAWRNALRSPGPLRGGLPLCLLATFSLGWTAHPAQARDAVIALWIGFACLVGWTRGLRREGPERLLSFTLAPGVLAAGLAIGSSVSRSSPPGSTEAFLEIPATFPIGAAGDLAVFLVLPLLVAQRRLAEGPPRWRRLGYLGSLGILAMGIAVSGSVTGFIAAAVSTVVLWWSAPKGRRRLGLPALVLVGIWGIVPLTPLAGRLETKLESLVSGGIEEALTGRLDGWRVAAELWFRRPLVGSGWGTYGAEFAPVKIDLVEEGTRFYPSHGFPTFRNAHDEILEVGAELGWLGIAALVWGLWEIRRAWRRIPGDEPGELGFARAGLLAGLLISLVYFPFRIAVTAYPFLLFLAWGFRRAAVEGIEGDSDRRASPLAVWALVASLTTVLGIHGFLSLRRLEAARTVGRVQAEIARVVDGARPAASLRPLLPDLQRASERAPGSLAPRAARGDVLLLLDRWAEARRAYDRALVLEPRAEVFLNRGRALEALGLSETAAEDRRRALILDPGLRKYLRD